MPQIPTHTFVNARAVLGVVGDPSRFEAIVSGIRTNLPTTYSIFIDQGLDSSHPAFAPFVDSLTKPLADGGTPTPGSFTPTEAAAIKALGWTDPPPTPPSPTIILTNPDGTTSEAQ